MPKTAKKAAATKSTKKASAKSSAKSTTTRKQPEIVDAPSREQIVDAFIAQQPARRQTFMRNWLKRGVTFATITSDDLRAMLKNWGRKATLVMLDVDSATLDAKLATLAPPTQRVQRTAPARQRFDVELQRSRSSQTRRESSWLDTLPVDLGGKGADVQPRRAADAYDAILTQQGRAAVTFDASEQTRVVRLDTVAEGSTVKTPDCPDDRLHGVSATLVRIGVGSCSVRLGRVHRSITTRDDDNNDVTKEFDAPGRLVTWARSTMVVPQ
jgi:hypothetical protein